MSLAPGTAVIAAATRKQDRIDEAFRTDGAVPWGEQDPSVFAAVDRFFGTTYRAALVSQWLPAATDYGGGPYDLICFFDSLHDMGDPLGALVHARRQLAPGGTVLAVEPMAAESPAEAAQSPAAQLYYPSSAVLCTPHAVSEGGVGLGNQVPEHTWRDVFGQAGFGHFRRATETPFNRVFEARA